MEINKNKYQKKKKKNDENKKIIHFWFRDIWYKLSDIFFAWTFQVFRNAIKSKKDFVIYNETFSNVSYVSNSNYKLWKYWHIHNVFEALFLSFLIYGRLLKKKICFSEAFVSYILVI